MKRPIEHRLEIESYDEFRSTLRKTDLIWAVASINSNSDYGEDLSIEIQDGDDLTSIKFLVQMKATQKEPTPKNLKYKVFSKHLKRWKKLSVLTPVYFCVYFKKTGVFYIKSIEEWLLEESLLDSYGKLTLTQKTYTLKFKNEDELTSQVHQIETKVKKRYYQICSLLDDVQYDKLAPNSEEIIIRKELNLSSYTNLVKDQGTRGTCVFISIIDCLEILGGYDYNLSIEYFISKYKEEYPKYSSSSGALIDQALNVLYKHGTISDKEWPYDPKQPNDAQPLIKSNDTKFYLRQFLKIDSKDSNLMKVFLDRGIPIIAGIKVYDSWLYSNDGFVRNNIKDQKIFGKKCIVIVGYEENNFIFRNTWGSDWAKNSKYGGGIGYFNIDYLKDLEPAYVLDEVEKKTIANT